MTTAVIRRERRFATGRRGAALLVALGISMVLVTLAPPAVAHEQREVGSYNFSVGFADEPAFTGETNAVQVTITELTEDGERGEPVVEGVDLEVEITFGDESMTLPVEPSFRVGVFGQPGDYQATFLPSVPGTWSFHLTGTIDGQPVDESFTSGPDTFSDTVDLDEVAFPARNPSNAVLADRLARESARLNEVIAAVDSGGGDSGLATVLASIGIVLGAAAVVVSVIRWRRVEAPREETTTVA